MLVNRMIQTDSLPRGIIAQFSKSSKSSQTPNSARAAPHENIYTVPMRRALCRTDTNRKFRRSECKYRIQMVGRDGLSARAALTESPRRGCRPRTHEPRKYPGDRDIV